MNTARAELGAVRLEELRFDNRYGRLPPDFYTRLSPTPLPDPYLVAFNPGEHYSYFPAIPELLVTFGFVAAELAIYLWAVKTFPILGGRTAAATRRS